MTAPNAQLVAEAWRRGVLDYKLLPHQFQLNGAVDKALGRPGVSVYVLKCARRFGKTTTILKKFLEHGLRHREHQMRWAAPTASAARDIVHPIFAQLTRDCPAALRPQWRTVDGCYWFPSTGSTFHIRGTDNKNSEKLRGTACHLGAIDEAGSGTDVMYVLKSILLPQTITCGGKILVASTPAKTPNHDFKHICTEAEAEGRLSLFTINDNSSLSPEVKAQIIRDCGGEESTVYRREYLCEDVTEETAAIVSMDWREELWGREEFELSNDPLGAYHHLYRSLDHGLGVDLTACIYGWYDFPRATLWVCDETDIVGHRFTTKALAEQVSAKWAERFGKRPPHRSVADNNNPLLLRDLGSMQGLHFTPVGEGVKQPGGVVEYLGGRPKENLEAMVNEMRLFIGAGRLRVHPRCRKLLLCLKGGIWDEKRREFDRDPFLGHYDHLAALMYLIRALDQHTNPIPNHLNVSPATHHIPDPPAPINQPQHQGWAGMTQPWQPDWSER